MPATSSAGPSVGPIRQIAVQPTQQATVTTVTVGPSPSSREEPPLLAAESTQVIWYKILLLDDRRYLQSLKSRNLERCVI